MPVMSGIELASRLSSSHPELIARIVLMTGGAHTARAQAALEQCGLTVISKPIDLSNLRRVLAKVGSAVSGDL